MRFVRNGRSNDMATQAHSCIRKSDMWRETDQSAVMGPKALRSLELVMKDVLNGSIRSMSFLKS